MIRLTFLTGVVAFSSPRGALAGYLMDDSSIRTAVAAWLSGDTATYGHISTWETGGVTDMSYLFCGSSSYSEYGCNSAAVSFNQDIGAWDTSGVTAMNAMFYEASAFNRDIGGWAVHSVEDMESMFNSASSFDQNLGWCVRPDVTLFWAFAAVPCERTSCGVVRGTLDANGEVVCLPAKKEKEESSVAVIVGTIAAVVLLLAVGGFWYIIRARRDFFLNLHFLLNPHSVRILSENSMKAKNTLRSRGYAMFLTTRRILLGTAGTKCSRNVFDND